MCHEFISEALISRIKVKIKSLANKCQLKYKLKEMLLCTMYTLWNPRVQVPTKILLFRKTMKFYATENRL